MNDALTAHAERLERLAAQLRDEGLEPDAAARLVAQAADEAARAAAALEQASR